MSDSHGGIKGAGSRPSASPPPWTLRSSSGFQVGAHHLLHPAGPGAVDQGREVESVPLPMQLQRLEHHVHADLVAELEAVRQGLLAAVDLDRCAIDPMGLDALPVGLLRESVGPDRGIAEGRDARVPEPAGVTSRDLCLTLPELASLETMGAPDSHSLPAPGRTTRESRRLHPPASPSTKGSLPPGARPGRPWKLYWNGWDFDEFYCLDDNPRESGGVRGVLRKGQSVRESSPTEGIRLDCLLFGPFTSCLQCFLQLGSQLLFSNRLQLIW